MKNHSPRGAERGVSIEVQAAGRERFSRTVGRGSKRQNGLLSPLAGEIQPCLEVRELPAFSFRPAFPADFRGARTYNSPSVARTPIEMSRSAPSPEEVDASVVDVTLVPDPGDVGVRVSVAVVDGIGVEPGPVVSLLDWVEERLAARRGVLLPWEEVHLLALRGDVDGVPAAAAGVVPAAALVCSPL